MTDEAFSEVVGICFGKEAVKCKLVYFSLSIMTLLL